MKLKIGITTDDVKVLDRFINGGIDTSRFDKKTYEFSYPSWNRGGYAWGDIEQGGTGIMRLIQWYQHVHRPGSKEWRPSVIVRAALEVARSAPAAEVSR